MKVKDMLNISENKKNKQSIWNPKKRKLKKLGLKEKDILNLEIKTKAKLQ